MDAKDFVEIYYADHTLRQVRVGNWIHTLNIQTGESWWEWGGPVPEKCWIREGKSYPQD